MCMAKFEVRYGIPEFLAGAPIMTSGNRVEGWGAVDVWIGCFRNALLVVIRTILVHCGTPQHTLYPAKGPVLPRGRGGAPAEPWPDI